MSIRRPGETRAPAVALALDDRVAPAAELARITGMVALRHYRSRLTVETKADGSPVTVADRAAEEAARAWVRAHFPDDGILGEELGEERPGARRRWVIDPIDGTKSFVRGAPLWGSLVALCEGERVLAGAAYFPAVEELVAAAPGAGCWWNGSRCHVSSVDALGSATVLTTDERFRERPERRAGWLELSNSASVSRSWGDCFGYLLVATGRAEAMCDPILSPWDAAALQPIIEEAGGVFTDWSGAATAFGGSAIATNRALADQVRVVLARSTSSPSSPAQ
ncbi:MAG TPA: histidinol-phosphatase [Gemmatimonadaceae bacterium]|jgi:histidinol phosphatase-like enzyme (inositol monophosphatase family)|nr:histidinol-phosphatase [Gemmatimonadaceae bacterium]